MFYIKLNLSHYDTTSYNNNNVYLLLHISYYIMYVNNTNYKYIQGCYVNSILTLNNEHLLYILIWVVVSMISSAIISSTIPLASTAAILPSTTLMYTTPIQFHHHM